MKTKKCPNCWGHFLKRGKKKIRGKNSIKYCQVFECDMCGSMMYIPEKKKKLKKLWEPGLDTVDKVKRARKSAQELGLDKKIMRKFK